MKSTLLSVLKYLKNLVWLDQNTTREQRYNSAVFFTFLLYKVWFLESKSFTFNTVYIISAVVGAWIIAKLTFTPLKSLYLRLKRKRKTKR
jgi:hypothetical protein